MTETEQGKVLWSDQVEEEMPSEGVYDFEENITIVNIGGRTFRKANVARKRCCAPLSLLVLISLQTRSINTRKTWISRGRL